MNEPLNLLEAVLGAEIGDSGARLRVRSWATRSPVVDLIAQRLPQTLTVVGVSYLVAILIAVPVGVLSAYRQHSIFDRLGTVVTMVGFSVPTFFTGTVLIVIFSAMLGWLPSVGLHGVVDAQVVHGERSRQRLERGADALLLVDVQRGAVPFGQRRGRYAAKLQHAVQVRRVHLRGRGRGMQTGCSHSARDAGSGRCA